MRCTGLLLIGLTACIGQEGDPIDSAYIDSGDGAGDTGGDGGDDTGADSGEDTDTVPREFEGTLTISATLGSVSDDCVGALSFAIQPPTASGDGLCAFDGELATRFPDGLQLALEGDESSGAWAGTLEVEGAPSGGSWDATLDGASFDGTLSGTVELDGETANFSGSFTTAE